MTCVNTHGDVFLQEVCLGKAGIGACRAGLAGCALRGAIVSTDRLAGYVRVLAGMGVAVHRRFSSGGSRAPLNRVNALHSALSHFLAPFRGVSTRRLHGYLMWFKWTLEARRSPLRTDLLLEQLGEGSYSRTWRSYATTPYPFHPELNTGMSLAG
jgi:hypothetical protein